MGNERVIHPRTLGVILAGGQARRMAGYTQGPAGDGDKALLDLDGQPLLAHVMERLAPQVDALVLNANGDPARFDGFNLPVIADSLAGAAGPLAGVLAAFEWALAQDRPFEAVVTVPGDSPFLPRDMVARLREAGQGQAAIAASAGRNHPVFGLFPLDLADDLRGFLSSGGRKVGAWTDRIGAIAAPFEARPINPFFNINTPDDLAEATRLAKDQRLT